MQIRTDRGWIKAGLAVLVAGVLGGGVMTASGIGPPGSKKVTAEGVTGKADLPTAAADTPLDLAAAPAQGPDAVPPPDPVLGEKIEVGSDGGSVTVSAVEDNVSAGRLFGAGEGQKYIAAEVKGCAGPNEKNLTFEPAYFLLRLDDGTVHDPGPGAKKPSLEGGKMAPGKCLSGWVTFTVKEGSLATAVIYDGSRRLTWTVPPPKNAKPTTTTTAKPAAAVPADDSATTTSTKPKTTATTGRTTATTARPTGTTPRPTTATGKPASTTTTTKQAGTTTSTAKSGSSAKSASSTTTSTSDDKAAGSTTTTMGKAAQPVPTPPTTSTTTDKG